MKCNDEVLARTGLQKLRGESSRKASSAYSLNMIIKGVFLWGDLEQDQ